MRTAVVVAVLMVIIIASVSQAEAVSPDRDKIEVRYGEKTLDVFVEFTEPTVRTYLISGISKDKGPHYFQVPNRIKVEHRGLLAERGYLVVNSLLDVDGVSSVGIRTDRIEVGIGRAFTWRLIQPEVLATLRTILLEGGSYQSSGREVAPFKIVNERCPNSRAEVFHFNRRLEMTVGLLSLQPGLPIPRLERDMGVLGLKAKGLVREFVEIKGASWVAVQPYAIRLILFDERGWKEVRPLVLEAICSAFGERDLACEIAEPEAGVRPTPLEGG